MLKRHGRMVTGKGKLDSCFDEIWHYDPDPLRIKILRDNKIWGK
jgi:hypothetical protein